MNILKTCIEEGKDQIRHCYLLDNGYLVIISMSEEHDFLVYSILDENRVLQICDFYPKDQREQLFNNIIKAIYESTKK